MISGEPRGAQRPAKQERRWRQIEASVGAGGIALPQPKISRTIRNVTPPPACVLRMSYATRNHRAIEARSSAISCRYPSLHDRLQNLLPHQRCVTMPKRPPQRSQTRGLRFCLMTPSHYGSIHAFGAPGRDSCSDRGSSRDCSRKNAWPARAGSPARSARSTMHSRSAGGASCQSPARTSCAASQREAEHSVGRVIDKDEADRETGRSHVSLSSSGTAAARATIAPAANGDRQ